jgi:rhodanese-related sulfurtransferase
MMGTSRVLTVEALRGRIGRADAPVIVDVRKAPAFAGDERMIAGAMRRPPDAVESWARDLPPGAEVAVYCVHGAEVSQGVAAALRGAGIAARHLEGGIEGWRRAGGLTMRKPGDVLAEVLGKPAASPTRWVTRARPKIDRIACPWLLRRFVDRAAEIVFVPAERVPAEAARRDALPFDVPDAAFSHDGPLCSFDAFLRRFGLDDPALGHLALIVRAADTGRLDLAPQAAGLLAVSLGLSALYPDDQAMLEHGMAVYDALYAWCRDAAAETHGWPPAAWVTVM